MTDLIFFDTDCLSSFLWMDRPDILIELYGEGHLILPEQVYDELSYPSVSGLKRKVDRLLGTGALRILGIPVEDPISGLYRQMTGGMYPGNRMAIGKGEAAAIALTCRYPNSILASNNIMDIRYYVKAFGLRHMTAGELIYEAYKQFIVSGEEADQVWKDMIQRRRALPTASFWEYLRIRCAG